MQIPLRITLEFGNALLRYPDSGASGVGVWYAERSLECRYRICLSSLTRTRVRVAPFVRVSLSGVDRSGSRATSAAVAVVESPEEELLAALNECVAAELLAFGEPMPQPGVPVCGTEAEPAGRMMLTRWCTLDADGIGTAAGPRLPASSIPQGSVRVSCALDPMQQWNSGGQSSPHRGALKAPRSFLRRFSAIQLPKGPVLVIA